MVCKRLGAAWGLRNGRYCYGNAPMETFLPTLTLAKQKPLNQICPAAECFNSNPPDYENKNPSIAGSTTNDYRLYIEKLLPIQNSCSIFPLLIFENAISFKP